MNKPFFGEFPITQTFAEHEERRLANGWQYYNGGIDWGLPERTPICAALEGFVSKIEVLNTGYGNVVKLDHENGLQTLYAHLSYSVVSLGQIITRGQMIGRSGNTGNSTGPHLHFEVRQDGVAVDPQPLLDGNAIGEADVITPEEHRENATGKVRVVAELGANLRSSPKRADNLIGLLPSGFELAAASGVEEVRTPDGITWTPVVCWVARVDGEGTVVCE